MLPLAQDPSIPKMVTLEEKGFPMRQPIVITTPYPTPEEIAQEYGVTPKRFKELQAMVTDFLSPSVSRKTKAKKRGSAFPSISSRHGSRVSDR